MTVLFNFFFDLFQSVDGTTDENHQMAVCRQADRDGPADSPTGSRYDGDSLLDDSPFAIAKETARSMRADIVVRDVRLIQLDSKSARPPGPRWTGDPPRNGGRSSIWHRPRATPSGIISWIVITTRTVIEDDL